MAKVVERKRTMMLVLSDEEMDALETLANIYGTNKSALIRHWIRHEIGKHATMPEPEELRRQLMTVFGDRIRRR